MKWPEYGCRTSGRDHPECRVVCMMPHPPPHIWVHPHNRSLQPLYFIYIILQSVHTFTNLQNVRTMQPSCPTISNSLVCTSTAASMGDPGSRRVTCLGEQPSAVASESNHGSSKASPTWFRLFFHFTLLELCIGRWWFGAHFFPFLFLLLFLFL